MAANADTRGIERINYLALLALGTFYFLCAFLPIYFGADHAKTLIDVLPARLIDGLGVAGGIMPAIGFAVLLKIMMKNAYIPYFILGFVGAAWLQLPGLLWALEGLAWDEQYLVRVCVALGELASHDPGGKWANRPSNSLATILLPWLPQTLASVDKRKVAVRTILNEWPNIAWNLIIQLLPGQHQTSSGSHKPSWRKTIPDDWEKGVTNNEYWQQASFYAELAVAAAGQDTSRLSALIDHFDNLPEPAFDQLLQALASQPISELPEEQRLSIWNHLTKFTNKHRRWKS